MRKFEVIATPIYKAAVAALQRKYHHITEDLEKVIEQLEIHPELGSSIPGYRHQVWKIRCGSRDMRKGKRAGFRVIYAWQRNQEQVYLLFVYAKTEKTNISDAQIKSLLQELERQLN
ncbi:type II toxin-antitoxin system RelE/ParE family toxin [bacterium]|nr:type II toxin-antitoxin system RelE/ParE family toxin [bacterium]MBU1614055.1 type II toxin-antitoxin system RelE/ParE family toxin [bacterium]